MRHLRRRSAPAARSPRRSRLTSRQGAIVSDVGSVKSAVIKAVLEHLPAHARFVPAHPVAGTENSGPDAGFRFALRQPLVHPDAARRHGRRCGRSSSRASGKAWASNVEIMSADHHDLVLAVTSHLPHLIAYNIVGTAADLRAGHPVRGDQILGRRLSRLHPHRRVRPPDHVARRVLAQQGGRPRGVGPLQRGSFGARTRHPLGRGRQAFRSLLPHARHKARHREPRTRNPRSPISAGASSETTLWACAQGFASDGASTYFSPRSIAGLSFNERRSRRHVRETPCLPRRAASPSAPRMGLRFGSPNGRHPRCRFTARCSSCKAAPNSSRSILRRWAISAGAASTS